MLQLDETIEEVDLIKSLADRMRNPDVVKRVIEDKHNRNPQPLHPGPRSYWSDLSIAGGYPGVLPLFVELDRQFPAENWDAPAHDYVMKIKHAIEIQGIHGLSMFGGLSGICYYLKHASRNGTRYKKILYKFNQFLIEKIAVTHLEPLKIHLQRAESPPPRLYEVMQGLSGIGIYGLANLNDPVFYTFVEDIVRLFLLLTSTIQVNGASVPGWHVRSDEFFLEEEKIRFPQGNFNMGLSHGIPGVLAFLSIAKLCGIDLPGHREAIEAIALWLKQKRKQNPLRFFWNASVSFEEETAIIPLREAPARDAWCYGSPGVSRSLYLAGEALNNSELKKLALDSFVSIFQSSPDEWNLPGPTFCHGVSGLLMVTSLMARDSGLVELRNRTVQLKRLLLSHYDSTSPLGFKDAEPMKQHGFAWVDRADLLEGVSGVLLTLLSLHSNSHSWHLPFLIDYQNFTTH